MICTCSKSDFADTRTQSRATQPPIHFFTKLSLSEMSPHLASSPLRPSASTSLSLSPPHSSYFASYNAFTAGSAALIPPPPAVSVDFKAPAFAARSSSVGAAADILSKKLGVLVKSALAQQT